MAENPKPKDTIFEKDLVLQGGTAGNRPAADAIAPSRTTILPDKGPSGFEVRLYILDNGRETDAETGRDPEWVDFTEFDGIYRIKSIPDVISIGAETTKPYVFKASATTINLNNTDFIFDNLKRANLKTISGNDALFLSTPANSNLNLEGRPAKVTGYFAEGERAVEKDLSHFIVRSVTTNTSGVAKIGFDSLEKQFIETQANRVKEGRNWYFDRSIKFLADELIKSVRRKYTDGREEIYDNDKVSIAGIETADGERVFSEFGRPIAEVHPEITDIEQGEKRLIVTAAAARNIFRSKLQSEVSVGANIISLRIDVDYTIKKGDVLTVGRASGATWDDLNEEKVTVLEDIIFSASANIQNVRISTLFKQHDADEIVERWMLYLGVTRKVEDDDEVYLLAFDPDRDESVDILNGVTTNNTLIYPARFIALDQTIAEYGIPTLTKMIVIQSLHTIPGKPGESAAIHTFTLDSSKDWDDPEQITTFQQTAINADSSGGGLYTGEMNFRSMRSIGDSGLFDVDATTDVPTDRFGAMGVGQIVQAHKDSNGINHLGFGYMAGLAYHAAVDDTNITIFISAAETEWWSVEALYDSDGNQYIGGTIYVFGTEEAPGGGSTLGGETFDFSAFQFSSRIKKTRRLYEGVLRYELEEAVTHNFNVFNSVVVVVPDTGKMYLRNAGENICVPEPQNMSVGEYDSDTEQTSRLTNSEYHNKIRFEKKSEIDREKTISPVIKNLVDTTSLDRGYYNSIVQKRKLRVQKGDTITSNAEMLNNFSIRVIPAQYIAMPWAYEHYRYGAQSLADGEPVYGLTDKAPTAARNPMISQDRLMHCWAFPIMGLWVKYDKVNKSILGFDESVVGENGNIELLGYWYMDHLVPSDPWNDAANIPRIELAYCDSKGLVSVSSTSIPDEHFPMCSILHNIRFYNNGGGANDFYGNVSDDMKSSIVEILGGKWVTNKKYYTEKVFSSPIKQLMAFDQWVTDGTQFTKVQPRLTSYLKTITWKFRPLKDPQADGTLFVSPFCNPVRPRHLHLPLNDVRFQGTYDNNPDSSADREEQEDLSYTAYIVDTEFEQGSEELLNYDDDGNLNIWVADRFSQNKTIGMITGMSPNKATGGILKGATLTSRDGEARKISLPLGFKTADNARKSEYQKQISTDAISKIEHAGSTYEITLSFQHNFSSSAIGCLIKITGSSNAGGTETVDGLYEILGISTDDPAINKRFTVNEKPVNNQGAAIVVVTDFTNWNLGNMLNYYGIDHEDVQLGPDANDRIPILNVGDVFSDSVSNLGYMYGESQYLFMQLLSGVQPSSTSNSTYLSFVDWSSWTNIKKMNMISLRLSNLNSTGNATTYREQNIDHLDALPTYPVRDTESIEHQVVGYHKTTFNCPPTVQGILNYPKALYAKSRSMFWSYYKRRSSGEFVVGKNAIGMITSGEDYSYTEFTSSTGITVEDGVNRLGVAAASLGADPQGTWNTNVAPTAVLNLNSSAEAVGVAIGAELIENYLGTGISAISIYHKMKTSLGNIFIPPINVQFIDTFSTIGDVNTAVVHANFHSFTAAQYNHYIRIINTNNLLANLAVQIDSVISTNVFKIKWTGTPTNISSISVYNGGQVTYDNNFNRVEGITIPLAGRILIVNVARGGVVYLQKIGVIEMHGGTTTPLSGDDVEDIYGQGDGTYDSGIKPTAWGVNFATFSAKWFLSRRDVNSDEIHCDTYTINHDGPFLGNDDNLYAIVNRHREDLTVTKYNYLRWCLNAQRNFKKDPNSADTVYFVRRKFNVTTEWEIRLDSRLTKFDPTGGVQHVVTAPDDVVVSIDSIDENTTPPVDSIEENGDTFYGIDENWSDVVEVESKGDYEIHGLWESYAGSQINFGYMRWKNWGDTSLEKFQNQDSTLQYVRNNENFSANQLVESADGANWFRKSWKEFPDLSVLEESIDTEPDEWLQMATQKWSFEVATLPIRLEKAGVEVPVATGTIPPIPSWSYGFQPYSNNYRIFLYADDANQVTFIYNDNTVKYDFDFHSQYYDEDFRLADLFFIKNWTEVNEDYEMNTTNRSLRGVIMRRHRILSTELAGGEKEKNRREFPCVFQIGGTGDPQYFSDGNYYSAHQLQTMRKFDYRVTAAQAKPYSFIDTNQNTMRLWDGYHKDSIYATPIDTSVGGDLPTVEGDFGQYALSLKIDNPYEEVFGFSSGPRTNIAAASFPGGRESVWKLSKSLAFHAAVADFEDLSVWEALSQFAELTDSILGFDRFGNLHLEPRPQITSETDYSFTFDRISLGNVISIEKAPAFGHTYNYVELIPHKPVLPNPKVDLTTQSDLGVVTANNDTFIRDHAINFVERDKNRKRPNISAYQKDFERKRIILICTNGQYDTGEVIERGLYSRWTYSMITDIIELRLAETIVVGVGESVTSIKVNKIPYNDSTDRLFVQAGDSLYIGNTGPYIISTVDMESKIITLAASIDDGRRYDAGSPINIFDPETQDASYNAIGDGSSPGEFTFSPKTFFAEIGEWAFDDNFGRISTRLAADIGPQDLTVPLDEVTHMPESGSISVQGEIIEYGSIVGTSLEVESGAIPRDLAKGSVAFPMPPKPILFGVVNSNYAPGEWRIGGYDEIGPSCRNEYHLLDPNEDESTYSDGDPDTVGKPITALEFFWEGQRAINYTDSDSGLVMDNTDYRTRHRTFVNMKIDFNGFRFVDGDKIDLDLPGIRLQPQIHLKKVETDQESIQRYGLRPYPTTKNRFFNNTTARIAAKKRIRFLSNIGSATTVVAKMEDVVDLDFLKIARVIDQNLFGGKESNTVRGYVSSLKFNVQRKIATISCLTEQL